MSNKTVRLNTIKSNSKAKKSLKRVGRGNGSGCGGTAGRGHKGQKSRSGFSLILGFEGGQMPLYRRIPKQKGFNNIFRSEYQIVNIGQLNNFDCDTVVNIELLRKENLISNDSTPVKLLANGNLDKKITISVHKASVAAINKVKALGGNVEVITS